MIKAVDEIPQSPKQTRKGYREQIRADIQEALDKRIEKFEFVGDYNFKYLAQYAREEADRIVRNLAYKYWRAHPEYSEKLYYNPFSWRDYSALEIIVISSIKGETLDKRRVFCKINMDMDNLFREFCERKVKIEEERQKKKSTE